MPEYVRDDWLTNLGDLMIAVHTDAIAAGLIEGVGATYNIDEWPASISVFPTILIGFDGGADEYGMSSPTDSHENIVITSIFHNFTLAQAQKIAYPWRKLIRAKLAANIKLGDTVESILPRPSPGQTWQGPGNIQYAGEQHVGILNFYDVKLNLTGTLTVSA